jgi:peptide/nickel transport system permease protein
MSAKQLLARLAQAVLVVWGAYTLSFVLLSFAPGDAVRNLLGTSGAARATPQQIADLRAKFGIDAPLVVQYFRGLGRLVTGDLGQSFTGQPVGAMIAAAFPPTLALVALATVIAILGAVLITVAGVLLPWSWLSRTVESLPALFVSVPPFWLGLLLIQIFSFGLGWFPSGGSRGFSTVVLPALLLGLAGSATLAQILGQSLRTNARSLYVLTARAKGASRLRATLSDALPNSVVPMLAAISTMIGTMFAFAVIAETVFSRNGLGQVLLQAVDRKDTPVVQAVIIVVALAYALATLGADLLMPLVSPILRRKKEMAQ